MTANPAPPSMQRHAATPPAVAQLLVEARRTLSCGQVELAEQSLAQALALAPDCTEAHRLIGIAALSGRMVGVLGLARVLGRPVADPGPGGHLVALRGAQPVALAVDRVLGVAQVDDEAVEPASAAGGMGGEAVSGYCPGAAAAEGADLGDFVILDLARLVRRALS